MKKTIACLVMFLVLLVILSAEDRGSKTPQGRLHAGTYQVRHQSGQKPVYRIPSVVPEDGKKTVPPYFALIRDPLGALTRSDVDKHLQDGSFKRIPQTELNFLETEGGVFWLAIQANNQTDKDLHSYLVMDGPQCNQVQFYHLKAQEDQSSTWYWEENGSSLAYGSRPIPVSPLVFDVRGPARFDSIIIIRIQHEGFINVNLSFVDDQLFMSELENQNLILALILGAILIMSVYAIVLYSTLHDRVFLWLILHLSASLFYVTVKDNFAFKYFWPNLPEINNFSTAFSMAWIALTAWFFTQNLFGHSKSGRQKKFLLGGLSTGVYILNCLFAPHYYLYLGGTILYLTAIMFLVLRDCTHPSDKARPEAPLVLTGMLVLLAGFGLAYFPLMLGMEAGLVRDALVRADHLAIIIESMILAFVLSGRLNALKHERDEAEAKNKLKQSFIANMSHEMRTPLNAIIGFSEAIERSNQVAEIHGYNNRILLESDRLLFQINQVLDLAKIEANKLEIILEPFNLHDSIDFLFDSYCQRALEKDINLQVRAPERKFCMVVSDRQRIEQVLRNLLDNAVKFTPRGSIIIGLSLDDLGTGYRRAHFSVSDTGIGIEPEILQSIFNEFEQGDSSITKRFGGTGLGTSIARRIVDALGGTIFARSSPGAGSTFSFILELQAAPPTAEEPEARPVPEVPKPLLGTNRQERYRILVVDDFETNRQVVCIHLKKAPVDIDCASNGEEALQLVEKNSYDLVLLDIFMPGLSGYDVVRTIRTSFMMTDLPVLGLTASGYEQDIKDAIDAGMNGVLTKPVKRAELLETIGAMLGWNQDD